MITDKDLKEAWDEGTQSDLYKICEQLLAERDAWRELAHQYAGDGSFLDEQANKLMERK